MIAEIDGTNKLVLEPETEEERVLLKAWYGCMPWWYGAESLDGGAALYFMAHMEGKVIVPSKTSG